MQNETSVNYFLKYLGMLQHLRKLSRSERRDDMGSPASKSQFVGQKVVLYRGCKDRV